MAENSKIEWTDHTFNPWRGCTKVSPGCANCYAEALSKRTGHGEYKRGVPRERMSANYWKQPLKWNAQVDAQILERCRDGEPAIDDELIHRPRVFCASLSDWLDDEVPIEWLSDLLDIIRNTPNLDWLLLTKRPGNFIGRLKMVTESLCNQESMCDYDVEFAVWIEDWIWQGTGKRNQIIPDNVWIGTTVEDQARADERIPELLKIPARVRFLSVEPMLEEIVLPLPRTWGRRSDGKWGCDACCNGDRCDDQSHVSRENCRACLGTGSVESIDWVICGGESGPRKRPFNPDWARTLRDQCAAAGVSFFMKQIDKIQPIPEDLMIRQFPSL